jgi:hypothetical protein
MRLKSGDQVQEAGRTLQDKSRTEPPRSQIQCSFVPAIIGRMPAGRSETGETVKGASRSAASCRAYEEANRRGLAGWVGPALALALLRLGTNRLATSMARVAQLAFPFHSPSLLGQTAGPAPRSPDCPFAQSP